MKNVFLIFSLVFALAWASSAHAMSATLLWGDPTTYTDGTPLPASSLGGCNIYSSPTQTGTFTKLGSVTGTTVTYTDQVPTPPDNTTVQKCYYVTDFLTTGTESGPSNTICTNFIGAIVAPSGPGTLTVIVNP